MSHSKACMALVENIYFSLDLYGDFDYKRLFHDHLETDFEKLKLQAMNELDFFIVEDIKMIGGIQRYPYGFSIEDKCRIYFAANWAGNLPIYCILSAQFLHLNSINFCMEYCKSVVAKIICKIYPPATIHEFRIKLSRVDICNHNTFIDLKTYIKANEYFKRVVTKIRKVYPVVERQGENDEEVPYFRYGNGDLAIRFYNKTKEVCEQQYKSFFFPRWKNFGLIDEKTFMVYENTYKLNFNYRVDFIFSNIFLDQELTFDQKAVAAEIYNNIDLDLDIKCEELKALQKEYGLKDLDEVVNVEYQLRAGYLKTLQIVGKDGEFIDFNNIENLCKHMDLLYTYLTNNAFRVIKRNSNYSRNRDKEVDPLWIRVQCAIILNISTMDMDSEIYRQYNNTINRFVSARDTFSKMCSLYYRCNDNVNTEILDQIDLKDIITNFKNESMLNENYFNIKDKLAKQIKYYGEKTTEDPIAVVDLLTARIANNNKKYAKFVIGEKKSKIRHTYKLHGCKIKRTV